MEKNIREARDKLEAEMDDAYHEHQANLLRQGKCICSSLCCVCVVLTLGLDCKFVYFFPHQIF